MAILRGEKHGLRTIGGWVKSPFSARTHVVWKCGNINLHSSSMKITEMSQLKDGMVVNCKFGGIELENALVICPSQRDYGMPTLLFNAGRRVDTWEVADNPNFKAWASGYKYGRHFFRIGGEITDMASVEEVVETPVEPIYKVGDVLVDPDGDERTVLGVCGKVYFLSDYNEPDCAKGTLNPWTANEIKVAELVLKKDEVESEQVKEQESEDLAKLNGQVRKDLMRAYLYGMGFANCAEEGDVEGREANAWARDELISKYK